MRRFLTAMAGLFSAALYAQDVPTLASITVETAPEVSFPLASHITFELNSSRPDALAENLSQWEGVSAKVSGDNTLSVSMTQQPRFTGAVSPKHSASSFVIDTDEASTQAFVDGFEHQQSEGALPAQMVRYVSGYMTEPSYIHGFNIASKVANERSGDCTEYAVLLTALARAQGLPSRVMIGTVLMEEADGVVAFGHAWTEVWWQDRWQIIDAALYQSPARQHFYLPAEALANEGPGYGLALVSAQNLIPAKITGLRGS